MRLSGVVGILPAENASSDPSHDWLGPSLAAVVAGQLTGSRFLHPQFIRTRGDIAGSGAAFVLYAWFDVRGDTVDLHVAVEERRRRRVAGQFRVFGALEEGPVPLAAAVAARLSEHRRAFGSDSIEAIRAYGEALAAERQEEREAAIERALEADPSFAEAVQARAELLAGRGQAERARDLLDEALGRGVGQDAVARARLRLLWASLGSERDRVIQALRELAELTPADAAVAERLGLSLLRERRLPEAAAWLGRAAEAEAGRGVLWNERGYALAYAGRFTEAVESLERYRQAEPDSANPLDSLGEVHFRFRRNAEAERYFLEAHRRAPELQGGTALLKAAAARLMLGDPEGAEKHFFRYAEGRRRLAGEHWAEVETARWRFATGRRGEALRRLEEVAEHPEAPREVRAAAHAQLAGWLLLIGDGERAARHAWRAVAAAGGRPGPALLARFLTQPAADAEAWRQRAERLPADADFRREALAWALVLAQHPAEAAVVLEGIRQTAPPFGGDGFGVLLAGALIEAGKAEQARPLIEANPLIQPGSEPLLYPLVFPRILYLRGVLAARAGDKKSAAENYRLFLVYSGDRELILGEEAEARQALARLGG